VSFLIWRPFFPPPFIVVYFSARVFSVLSNMAFFHSFSLLFPHYGYSFRSPPPTPSTPFQWIHPFDFISHLGTPCFPCFPPFLKGFWFVPFFPCFSSTLKALRLSPLHLLYALRHFSLVLFHLACPPPAAVVLTSPFLLRGKIIRLTPPSEEWSCPQAVLFNQPFSSFSFHAGF